MHRAIVTFSLNALYGRRKTKKGPWIGPWDSSNAHDFMKYTISKGYQIDSWEFGMFLGTSYFLSSQQPVQIFTTNKLCSIG